MMVVFKLKKMLFSYVNMTCMLQRNFERKESNQVSKRAANKPCSLSSSSSGIVGLYIYGSEWVYDDAWETWLLFV